MPEYSQCQFDALGKIHAGNNVFLTGAAGTGKSFIINQYIGPLDRKVWPVLASTGAAAIRVGGRTFHSFFGLGIMEGGYDATIERALRDARVSKRLKKCMGVIIDEISMIPHDALQAAEEISRWARDSDEPWGGLQIIAVGDFFQLPPVTRGGEIRRWAFQNPVWGRTNFQPCVLKTIHRTKDDDFIAILNQVRKGVCSAEVKDYLNGHLAEDGFEIEAPRVFARRMHTEKYNLSQLNQIPGTNVVIDTEYSGKDYGVNMLKKQAPVPPKLILKQGAFVMIRQNDPKGRWVNGSLGHIREMKKDHLLIELHQGPDVEIKRSTFEALDADGKTVATATNFPVNLAYASTIHKSQGSTLDTAVLDLKNLWEPGQAYVAMSRLREGRHLHISGWDEKSILSDPQVERFYESLDFI